MSNGRITIRQVREEDIDEIYFIEKESFDNPWNHKNILHELNLKFSIFILAEIDASIAGYAIAWQVQDELQVNKIAVKEEYRRMDIGTLLCNSLFSMTDEPAKRIFLEVREKNVAAQQFYQKLGFNTVGFRKDYYKTDNALLMEKRLPADEDQ